MTFEYLYDDTEKPLSRYVSFATGNNRYDFNLIFTQQFDGKSFIMSLQNLQAVLISSDEIIHDSSWITKLGIACEDIEIVKSFLQKS